MNGRRLDYRYENFHGFLFFLSTVFFVLFWAAVYRYYTNKNADNPSGLPNNYLTRFSSRQQQQQPPYPSLVAVPGQFVVMSSPGPQQQTNGSSSNNKSSIPTGGGGGGSSGKQIVSMSTQPPMMAAYVVDDFGRRSMIPMAVAIPVQASRTGNL